MRFLTWMSLGLLTDRYQRSSELWSNNDCLFPRVYVQFSWQVNFAFSWWNSTSQPSNFYNVLLYNVLQRYIFFQLTESVCSAMQLLVAFQVVISTLRTLFLWIQYDCVLLNLGSLWDYNLITHIFIPHGPSNQVRYLNNFTHGTEASQWI